MPEPTPTGMMVEVGLSGDVYTTAEGVHTFRMKIEFGSQVKVFESKLEFKNIEAAQRVMDMVGGITMNFVHHLLVMKGEEIKSQQKLAEVPKSDIN